jgi:hypothetical protein
LEVINKVSSFFIQKKTPIIFKIIGAFSFIKS